MLGLPLLLGVLWLMERMGELWWLYVWGVWVAFNLLLLFIYPTYIAPLFNDFEPLQDETQKARIEGAAQQMRLYRQRPVRDGRQQAQLPRQRLFHRFRQNQAHRVLRHAACNASLPSEIDAVLAHELGHFKLRHVLKRIALPSPSVWASSGCWRNCCTRTGSTRAWASQLESTALALLLFFMALPVFTFLLHPIASAYSRKHEFEADAYAAQQTDAQ